MKREWYMQIGRSGPQPEVRAPLSRSARNCRRVASAAISGAAAACIGSCAWGQAIPRFDSLFPACVERRDTLDRRAETAAFIERLWQNCSVSAVTGRQRRPALSIPGARDALGSLAAFALGSVEFTCPSGVGVPRLPRLLRRRLGVAAIGLRPAGVTLAVMRRAAVGTTEVIEIVVVRHWLILNRDG